MPALSFKSGTLPYPPPASPDILAWIEAIPSANVTHADDARMILDGAALAAVPDPYGFVQSPDQPTRDRQRMAAFLLNDAPRYLSRGVWGPFLLNDAPR